MRAARRLLVGLSTAVLIGVLTPPTASAKVGTRLHPYRTIAQVREEESGLAGLRPAYHLREDRICAYVQFVLAGTASHPRRGDPRRRHPAQPASRTRPHATWSPSPPPTAASPNDPPSPAGTRPSSPPSTCPNRPATSPSHPATTRQPRCRRLTTSLTSARSCSNTTQTRSSRVYAGQTQISRFACPPTPEVGSLRGAEFYYCLPRGFSPSCHR
jgi:hypothetical protein